jgi:ribosome-associated translation inhibitor RaiA
MNGMTFGYRRLTPSRTAESWARRRACKLERHLGLKTVFNHLFMTHDEEQFQVRWSVMTSNGQVFNSFAEGRNIFAVIDECSEKLISQAQKLFGKRHSRETLRLGQYRGGMRQTHGFESVRH